MLQSISTQQRNPNFIIAYREANGSFKSVDDLDKVKGFGKASIEKIRTDLSVDADSAKKK